MAAMQDEIESVWDYPRPPRIELSSHRVRVVHRGIVLADSHRSLRILETSHPPVYYIPPSDIAMQFLKHAKRRSSFCEFKGAATYWSILPNETVLDETASPAKHFHVPDVAWSYAQPTAAYAGLKDHLAFYANRVDQCFVGEEQVSPQTGDFYGGWITSHVRGPFKGAPGTLGW